MQLFWKAIYDVFKVSILFKPEIPLLGIYLKEIVIYACKKYPQKELKECLGKIKTT